jgi:hypothetical protein
MVLDAGSLKVFTDRIEVAGRVFDLDDIVEMHFHYVGDEFVEHVSGPVAGLFSGLVAFCVATIFVMPLGKEFIGLAIAAGLVAGLYVGLLGIDTRQHRLSTRLGLRLMLRSRDNWFELGDVIANESLAHRFTDAMRIARPVDQGLELRITFERLVGD